MWAAGLLLTSNQSRDDYAIITINLHADVAEEFPVVPLRLTVSTEEFFQPVVDDPFIRRTYLNQPVENPLSEGGAFEPMISGQAQDLEKYDPAYGEGYEDWALVRSDTAGQVATTYWTATEFGPNSQVMINPYAWTTGGIVDLYLNIQDAGTLAPTYYRLRVTRGGSNNWVFSRFDAGVETVLDTASWSVFGGDWIMLRRVGSNFTAYNPGYYSPDEETYDPDWYYEAEVFTVTDSGINEAGHIGFGGNALVGMRNFWAGDAETEYIDEEEVYLTITPITKLEGIAFQEVHFSFENLDQWHLHDVPEEGVLSSPHFHISRKHASEGDTALRYDVSTMYPFQSYKMEWLAVDGGLTDTVYWLGYSFYIWDWKDVWMAGNGGDGNGYPARLPGFNLVEGYEDLGWQEGPTLEATSQAAGELTWFSAQYPTLTGIPLNHKQWYAIKMSLTHDSATDEFTGHLWIDDVFIDEATIEWTVPKPILGIAFDVESARAGGQIYIDDMSWSAGDEPATASDTETGDQTTTEQWVKIRDRLNIQTENASIFLEIDPDQIDTYPSAWIYTEVYIPESIDDFSLIPNNGATRELWESDAFGLYIYRIGSTSNFEWRVYTRGTPNTLTVLGPVTLGRWYRLQSFYDGNNPGAGVTIIIDQDSYNCPITGSSPPGGVNYHSHNFALFDMTPPINGTVWYGVDNMAWALNEPVTSYAYNYVVDFEGENPLEEYQLFYPGIPVDVQLGPGDYIITDEEGGFGPGPGLPVGSVNLRMTVTAEHEVSLSTFGEIYLNLEAISGGTYVDTETIPLVLSVLGGECFSTWSGDNVGVGEANLRWMAGANLRWSSEQELRWSNGEVSTGETIHC